MIAQPLWENEEWSVCERKLKRKGENVSYSRNFICSSPYVVFRHACQVLKRPDLLYDAFLQLATLWDLQCSYDELRKIRDQAKQERAK